MGHPVTEALTSSSYFIYKSDEGLRLLDVPLCLSRALGNVFIVNHGVEAVSIEPLQRVEALVGPVIFLNTCARMICHHTVTLVTLLPRSRADLVSWAMMPAIVQ